MADKRNFNKAERSRLIKVFIESKTVGFKNNVDKEFMLDMLHLNREEFETLERTTHRDIIPFYENGCFEKEDKEKTKGVKKKRRRRN